MKVNSPGKDSGGVLFDNAVQLPYYIKQQILH